MSLFYETRGEGQLVKLGDGHINCVDSIDLVENFCNILEKHRCRNGNLSWGLFNTNAVLFKITPCFLNSKCSYLNKECEI